MIKRVLSLLFLGSLLSQGFSASVLSQESYAITQPLHHDKEEMPLSLQGARLLHSDEERKKLSPVQADLHASAKSLNIKSLVENLIINKSSPNIKNQEGELPLVRVLAQEDVNVDDQLMAAALLLKYGADVNLTESDQTHPLHALCEYTQAPGLLDLLLENKADVNVQDNSGQTPLHLAAILGKEAYVAKLLNVRADVGIRDRMGSRTPLLATANTHGDKTKIIELLLEAKADPNDEDDFGTVLHNLAEYNSYSASVILLLEKGADPQKKGKGGLYVGKTPFEVAETDAVRDLLSSDLLARDIVGMLWKKALPPKEVIREFLQEMQPTKLEDKGAKSADHSFAEEENRMKAESIKDFKSFLDVCTLNKDPKYFNTIESFLKILGEVAMDFDFRTLSNALTHIKDKYSGNTW